MLDNIKATLERARAELEAQRDNEVNNQILNAQAQIISPKVATIEELRTAALEKAANEYEEKKTAINKLYDNQINTYKVNTENAIAEKVKENYAQVIANIDKQLNA